MRCIAAIDDNGDGIVFARANYPQSYDGNGVSNGISCGDGNSDGSGNGGLVLILAGAVCNI
jgi:hypothetical protein